MCEIFGFNESFYITIWLIYCMIKNECQIIISGVTELNRYFSVNSV